MNLHTLDLDRLLWSVLFVHWDGLDHIQSVPALQDSSKHGVLPVQMRRRRIRYVELAAVRSRTFVCHAQDATRMVSERDLNLVRKVLSINRIAVFCAA